MTAKQILDSQFEQLCNTLAQAVNFPTEKSAPEGEGKPFGGNIANCLNYVLTTAQSFGLDTYNCDGYAGHVDFKGTGKQVLGILGHLDVVPATASEWKYPPYNATVAEGRLFGRGTMDDKGPMIACLFAVKALKDSGFVPSKTIRLIFGCDEESGMECVEHYFAKMPKPDVSFSPDGDFPVINREKGIYQFNVVLGRLPEGVTVTAGDRANVVPSLCKATCNKTDTALASKLNVTLCGKELSATGKAAHGSTPDEGVNATHAVLQYLSALYPDNETLAFASTKLTDTTGARWGVNLTDQPSGKLTCNLGVLRTGSDGTLTATMDIRFPVTYTCKQMYDLLRRCTPAQYDIVDGHTSEPLFVPSDSDLVTTLMDVYNKATDSNLEPIAIGGGTYSRCLPNCVAFGPLFPGEEQTIHMPNECIILDNLKKMCHIYLEAIERLSK